MHTPSGWAPLPDVDLIAAALPEQRAPYGSGGSSRAQGWERDWGRKFSAGQSGSGAEAARKQGLVSRPSGVRPEPMQQALPRSPGEGTNRICAGTSQCQVPPGSSSGWVGLVHPAQNIEVAGHCSRLNCWAQVGTVPMDGFDARLPEHVKCAAAAAIAGRVS